jgi:hypothetical protein
MINHRKLSIRIEVEDNHITCIEKKFKCIKIHLFLCRAGHTHAANLILAIQHCMAAEQHEHELAFMENKKNLRTQACNLKT